MSTLIELTALPVKHSNFIHDLSRRFKGGWLLMDNEPVFLRQVDAYGECLFDLSNGKQITIDARNINNNKFSVWIPKMGYYASNNGYIYIYQIPTRQYVRTFSFESYKINVMDSFSLKRFGVLSIYNEAVHKDKKYLNKHLGYVLTRQLLISNNSDLFYYNCIIGKVDTKQRTIRLSNPFIQQEIMDILKRSGDSEWNFV